MYIKRVKLEHFKRHDLLDVEFTPGVNAICGPNGAGKSSVIEAIGYALFNAKPYRSTTELVKKGAKQASIWVEFEAAVDERLYRVERTISAKGGGRYTVRDALTASVIAEGTKDSQEHLQTLMEADPESKLPKLFETILGVPQGTMTSAFLLPPGERKAIFAPLLRVEEYEQAWSQMKDDFLKPLRDDTFRQELQLQQVREQLISLPQREETHQELQQRIEVARRQLQEMEEKLPLMGERLTQLRQERERHNTLLQQQRSLRPQRQQSLEHLQASEKRLQQTLEAQAILKQEEAAYQEHTKARQTYNALRQQQREALQKREQLQRTQALHHRKQIEWEQLEQQLKESLALEQEYQKLQPALAEQQEVEKQLRQLQETLSSLPYLRQNLKDLELSLQLQLTEEKNLIRKAQELEQALPAVDKIRQVEDEGKVLRNKRDQWLREQERRQEEQKRLAQMHKEFQHHQERLEASKREEQELTRTYQPSAARLEEHERDLEKLRQRLLRLEAQIEREEEFRKSISGNVCPFFQQTCKNLPEGHKLGEYIGETLKRSGHERQELHKQVKKREEEKQSSYYARQKLNQEGEKLHLRKESYQKELQRLDEQKQQAKQKLQETPDRGSDLEQANEQLLALRHHYKALKPQVEQAQQFEPAQTSLRLLQEEIQRKRKEQEEQQKQLDALSKREAELPPLEAKRRELEDPCQRARQIAQTLAQLPSLREKHERSNQERLVLARDEEEQQKQLQLLLPALEQGQQLEEQLKRTEASYERYLHYQQSASQLEPTRHAQQVAKEQHERIEAEWADVNKELEVLEARFQPSTLVDVEREHTALVRQISEHKGRLPADEERLSQLGSELKVLREKQASLQEDEQAHKEQQAVIECAEVLRKMYKQAGPHMTRALIRSISAEADRLFRHLLSRSHLHLHWDESFELFIEEEGNERSYHNLSGGEQMAAALAVRMALIKELSSIRVAFFDEPTAHMDTTRRYNLAMQLSQVKGFDQLFVISHDDTFETMTDHVVWIDPDGSTRMSGGV